MEVLLLNHITAHVLSLPSMRHPHTHTHTPTLQIQVLDGLNLTIEAGTTVALVGRSGCGKSTVVSLIQRFYDPTSGVVCLDDMGSLKDLDVYTLRNTMGLVRPVSRYLFALVAPT